VLKYEHILNYAAEAGFTLCGVARARVLAGHAPWFEAGLEASGEGVLPYLAREWRRRLDPSTLLADARTVIVCALAYDGFSPVETDAGRVSAHRRNGDYHPGVKAMLREVSERLRAENPPLRAKVCCDTSAILEKAWAVEAGLGWQGRNTLLVNPMHGSFLLLGVIVLDAECDRYDEPFSGVGCGSCRRCEEACPTGALRDRTVDTGRCISALTIERSRKGLPAEPINGWVSGCDECQTACPHNLRRVRLGALPLPPRPFP
jgi:epoxyqueuosine reductase